MKRTRINPISKKRRAALRSPERVRVGVQIPAACELCPLVYDVDSYREFAGLADDHQFRIFDPHHVWNAPRKRFDAPCNVVTVCRVCHEFAHECFGRAARMIATEALCRAGRFDRQRCWAAFGRDPIAAIHVDYDNGIFACDPTLDALATMLLQRF